MVGVSVNEVVVFKDALVIAIDHYALDADCILKNVTAKEHERSMSWQQ